MKKQIPVSKDDVKRDSLIDYIQSINRQKAENKANQTKFDHDAPMLRHLREQYILLNDELNAKLQFQQMLNDIDSKKIFFGQVANVHYLKN